ncbi:MAG: cation:proton antiporter [Desulfonatronovibrio sp.]
MTIYQGISIILCLAGGFFFFAGTIGLLRFPDTYTRLHALTKADNLGLGFMVLGLAFVSGSIPEIIKLGLTWFLALIGSSSACYIIGNYMHYSSRTKDNEDGFGL